MQSRALGQFARFAVVGLASNAVLFLLYLLATSLGVGHKLAMSVLFFIGVLQSFIANKAWSFRHNGEFATALTRYFAAYLAAYFLNLAVLIVLVDGKGYSDRIVQGVTVIVIAMMLFLAQKFWIFRPSAEVR